jgi:hypothetical protein
MIESNDMNKDRSHSHSPSNDLFNGSLPTGDERISKSLS